MPEQPETEHDRARPAQPPDPAPSEGSAAARRSFPAALSLAIGAVALAAGIIWLARDTGDRRSVQTAGGSRSTSETSGDIGKPARLDLTLKDLNGTGVNLTTFKGKVVVLNFWATWCGPCRTEIPDLVKLQEQYREDLVILGLLVLDPVGPQTQPFVTEFRINYRVLDANNRDDVEEAYGPLWGLPTSVIIGRDGRVAQRFAGARSKEQFEREIGTLR